VVVIIEIVSCNVSIDQISADCLPYRLERASEPNGSRAVSVVFM